LKDSTPTVAAVIVNWNQRDLLLEAVESVVNSSYADTKVIVVDNASSDESVDAVRQAFPEVEMIVNDRNLGFAEGSNQGLELAIKEGIEYVLFLNNDATLDGEAIKKLIDLLERKPEAGAAAPYIFYYDRRDVIWYGGGEVSLWRGRIGHRFLRRRFNADKHKAKTTDYLTGCVFIARTEVLKSLGGFDTSIYLYSEDVDLSLKLRKAGWQLWVQPDAKAYHRISVTSGGELSPFKAFHRARSNIVIVKRWAEWWEFPTLMIGGLLAGSIISARLLLQGRVKMVISIWRGIISGLLGFDIPVKFRLDR